MDPLSHKEVHESIQNCETFKDLRHKGWTVTLTSAGFYDPKTRKASGKSESLRGLKSLPKDGAIIANYDYEHGLV
jgi:hypothetical protein